ncbi:conserved hypothetical protein [Bosea sp. 62]|uniref:hypothetical protein n=1 Tax=unclassified Bosea (in: a-proteobacteria) TaxID=2653178 RepID=UPI0012521ECD|nr:MULTISPECIES: hypothetical protein [unclassified Bosea (in: a-proteobacteria)]CAD5255134.1 conserved hypothetical protein [Bosea sp. 21B]CAD5285170.1 conserved hypothetical protein [Bosea sp. 7B]CAD5301578.1 conserved hypothetical protein [Bosea sp. 46]VVT57695.1 conserved hypothetical protein [Bosea sp. EC-HK365B]VXB29694.1 conserved hypothetical protein [Bosea sp. 29B]
MCDYSLHHVMSTPAKVGDVLKTTGFPGSSTRGFCAVSEPNVAVCVMPGTELVFSAEIECDRAIGFLPHRRLGETLARFRQIDLDKPYAHHDAIELPNGRIELLTNLSVGQTATVLQLPADEQAQRAAPAEAEPAPARHEPILLFGI